MAGQKTREAGAQAEGRQSENGHRYDLEARLDSPEIEPRQFA